MRTPQNVYDDPTFFAGYRDLRRDDTGLNGVLEVPALRAALPDLKGLRVLDMGCGFGDFARYARSAGASSVTAVDISTNMLEEAARLTDDPAITYVQAAFETYAPPDESFDLVVSSLALHYVDDYAAVVRRMVRGLRQGGTFVFTVEHPACTACPTGWVKSAHGDILHWPLDHYGDEGERDTRWFIDGVKKFHRTIETYVSTLLEAGFHLDQLREPKPSADAVRRRPELAALVRRPPVLLLAATKWRQEANLNSSPTSSATRKHEGSMPTTCTPPSVGGEAVTDDTSLGASDLDEIRRLENDLRTAMLAGDVDALAGLLDDRLVFTAPDCSLLSKRQDLAAHATGWLKLLAIDVVEASFHRVDDIVLTTTRANLSGSVGGAPFRGLFAYTRLWSRSSGRWRVVAGHASAVPS